jgi:hypothetical protein
MKKGLILSWMALALVACDKPSTTATEAPTEARAGEDAGNAGDPSQPEAKVHAPEFGSHSTYTGKIDGKIEATIDLYRLEDDLGGTITYKKSGEQLMVLGIMEDEVSFFMRQYLPDGLVTGVMWGEMKGDKLSGGWMDSSIRKEQKLEMIRKASESNIVWPYTMKGSVVGEYGFHYPEMEGEAGLTGVIAVKSVGENLTYSLDCVHGSADMAASIPETEAVLDGNVLKYEMPVSRCEFEIRFFDGFAAVEHVGEHHNCGLMGAIVVGEYVKLR